VVKDYLLVGGNRFVALKDYLLVGENRFVVVKDYLLMGENRFVVVKDYLLVGGNRFAVLKDYLLVGGNRFLVLKDYLLVGENRFTVLKDYRPARCLVGHGTKENVEPMPNYETAFYDSGVFYDTPGTGNQPKKGTHMAGNRVPNGENELLALGEDMADGCHNHEVDIGLKHNKEVDMRAALTALRNAEAGFTTARGNRQDAMDALHATDATVTAFLAATRSVLIRLLGNRWSSAWLPTGFPDLSTAVPATQEKRLNLCASLKIYFTNIPAQEVAAMGVTAANAETQFQALSTGRDVLGTKDELQTTAKQARDTAYNNLRKREHDLINELATLLADDDGRWHAFGLSMPADPNAPESVASVTLTPGAAGKIVADWPRAVRATRYRPFVQVVGVDTDFVARDAVHDLTVNLTGFTTGQTVKVQIVAANDAGEALPSPTQQIVAP